MKFLAAVNAWEFEFHPEVWLLIGASSLTANRS